jgi:hypothetical protein
MKIVYKLAHMVLLAVVITQLDAREVRFGSKADLGMALQDAALCKRDTFIDDGENIDVAPVNAFDDSGFFDSPNESMADVLTRLGVKIEDKLDPTPESGGEIKYTFPPGVMVLGHEARTAIYREKQAGNIFYVELVADSSDLVKLRRDLGLVAVRKFMEGSAYVGLEHTQYYKPVHPPAAEDPYPDTVVASQRQNGGQSFVSIGCQTFETD